MSLPKRLDWNVAQDRWASELDPLLNVPITNGILLSAVELRSGINIINHRLGRKLMGWFIVRINGPATIYDNQSTNSMTDLTLSLTCNASVMVNLWVF